MRKEDGYVREGHIARTLTRERDLRIVLVVMTAGSRIASIAPTRPHPFMRSAGICDCIY